MSSIASNPLFKAGVLGMASSSLVELARYVDSPISAFLPTQETNAMAFGASAALVVGVVAKSVLCDTKPNKLAEDEGLDPNRVIPIKGDKFAFPTKDSSKLIQGYIYDKKYIAAFLERKDIPEKLKEFIKNYISRDTCLGKISYLEFPVIGLLSDETMKALLAEYATKYGIQIEMCRAGDLNKKIQQLKGNPPPSPFGLIVLPEDNVIDDQDYPHVTPLLCHFTEDKQQVVIMDALGWGGGGLPTYKQSISTCDLYGYDYQIANNPRQVDGVSCRTSAVVLLRNALLDIKIKQNEGTFIDIVTLTTLVGAGSAEKGSRVTIPCEWDCHDQIINRSQTSNIASMPRLPFSKKAKPPMTVEDFRKRHTNLETFKYRIHFIKSRIETSELTALTYPPDVGIEVTDNKTLILNWQEKKKINTYLVYKSLRNGEKEVAKKSKEQE